MSTTPAPTTLTVVCPYCRGLAALADSAEVYGRSYGMIWICRPCGAYVGTHKGSKDHKPLGRLAKADLRAARIEAHRYFDEIWKAGHHKKRRDAYAWLAGQMGRELKKTHISWFDLYECQQVIKICRGFLEGRNQAAG